MVTDAAVLLIHHVWEISRFPLRKVCEFFGIELLPEMLDVSHSQEAQQISRMSAPWSSNCFAPIVANIGKDKKALSMDKIATSEMMTGEYMHYYGYKRTTDNPGRLRHGPVRRGARPLQTGSHRSLPGASSSTPTSATLHCVATAPRIWRRYAGVLYAAGRDSAYGSSK